MKTKDAMSILDKAQSRYVGQVGKVEAAISDYVSFDFSIEHKEADGWTLIIVDEGQVATLDRCLKVIEDKGALSLADALKLAI